MTSATSRLTLIRSRARSASIMALVLAMLSVAVVYAVEWPDPEELPGSTSSRGWDFVDVAAEAGTVYVAWAKEEAGAGVQVSIKEGTLWSTAVMSSPPSTSTTWSPSVAHSGNELGVAWVQGDSDACSTPHSVMQQDLTDGTASVVLASIYGVGITPDIAVGDSGWHMVFAAAESSGQCSAGSTFDLYYTHRATADDNWENSAVLVPHDRVLGPLASGGIWYPRVAVDSVGATLYVVWEQYELTPPSAVARSVWMITGTLAVPPVQWAQPVRLSPVDQQYAVRPVIATDKSGGVHAVWTRYLNTNDQAIYYLRPLEANPPRTLNTQPVRVSDNAPKYAETSIATEGTTLCVAWHGYADVGPEEVTLRCSDDSGNTWRIAHDISESPAALSVYPEIALSEGAIVAAVWPEYALVNNVWETLGVYYRSGPSPDDGRVFLPLVMRGR